MSINSAVILSQGGLGDEKPSVSAGSLLCLAAVVFADTLSRSSLLAYEI